MVVPNTQMLLTCARCCVPHSLSRVRSLCVPPGHTLFPQWYSHCSCKGKHLSAVSCKAKFSGQFSLKNRGISLHTSIKDIFLSARYASQDVDALCDMIYTQLSRNASKNWKTTVVCLNALFHLIQPTSHYEPQGASFLRPPRCQQLEKTVHSNAPGVALKAVTDITSTAFCNRSSSADLLAGYLKLPQTREIPCLWRKKLTSLSFPSRTTSLSFLLPPHSW